MKTSGREKISLLVRKVSDTRSDSSRLRSEQLSDQLNQEAPLTHEDRLLRAGEVAAMLGIGRTKAYELIAAGVLPVVRIGTLVRVPRAKLIAWIDQNTAVAA